MISLLDIKKAIVTKLKYIKDVNIVANDIRGGFDKPAFFIKVMPIGTISLGEIQERTVNVYLDYFSEDKTDLDNLKMENILEQLFVNTLKVDDRVLTLYDKNQDINDNVLNFMFTLRYIEDTPIPLDEAVEEYENMQDLYMNL